MSLPTLADQTVEQRAAAREKAQASRAANIEARRKSPLRRDFLDATEWETLAHDLHIRLPPWGVAPTTSEVRKFLKKINWTPERMYEWMGGPKRLDEFQKRNPTWPMRALAGLLLEQIERKTRFPYCKHGVRVHPGMGTDGNVYQERCETCKQGVAQGVWNL